MPNLMPPPQIVEPTKPHGHGPIEHTTLIYHVTLLEGSLNPDLDVFGIGPLQFGDSVLNNPAPEYTFVDGELVLSVKLPANGPNSVTAGVFATATTLPFNSQLPFMLEGTYISPYGPSAGTHDETWAVGILARNGGVEDLAQNTQVVATLQFNPKGAPGTARLNVPMGAMSHTPVLVPPLYYDAIVGQELHGRGPVPFTLRLSIDPTLAAGQAFLTLTDLIEGPRTFSTSFVLNPLPTISAVGTVVANQSAYDETVSVRVRDFGIYSVV